MDCSTQASLSFTNSQSLLKLVSIVSVMTFNHLILCCPLPFPPSIFSSIMGFFNESVLHIRWPKDWSFSLSISSSNEYSGLISFRLIGLILHPKGLSRGFPNTTAQKYQFFRAKLLVGHYWATSLSLFTFMHWRRTWQPTPVFLTGESQGWGSLVGCRLWGRTELDTTEAT